MPWRRRWNSMRWKPKLCTTFFQWFLFLADLVASISVISKVQTGTVRPHIVNAVFSEVHVRYVVVRPSVVCLSVCNVRVRTLYSGKWNFRQCFYAMWYLGHPWLLYKNFTEIVPGELSRRGLKPRGVAKYSDFGPFEGYISETRYYISLY